MANFIDLNDLPFFECEKGDTIEVFINGKSRGLFRPSYDFRFYCVVDSDKVENDNLPF